MMQLDSPKLQKSIEKFRYGKCKTTFHEITEYNGLKGTFHGVIFTFSCTPLDHTLRFEKTQILSFLHCCFRHFAFAPTYWHIGHCFLFNLRFVLLGSHLKVTSLGSGATRGAVDLTERGKVWNPSLTAARSSKGKTLRSYQMDLYDFWWQFCKYLGDQRILSFSEKFFITYFATSLLWFLNLNGEI